MAYRLTVRAGAKVDRERFDELDPAIAALRRHAAEVQAAGNLPGVKMLREFEPSERVAARLEISTGGLLRRGREAGLDVMGDGTIVAFSGGIGRRPLEPQAGETQFDAVRRALAP